MMKMDMSGAAAVLATMTALKDLGCRNKVTAWLMCTDNMPSGSALKLGDVLHIRNGKTVEIHNTDAEGRLILADGLSLAAEAAPDAIVDIATLTGAAMAALGQDMAAVIGSDDGVIDQVKAAADAADEPVWEMPLAKERYRKLLDSVVADMKNVGGPYAGATTAAIFLSEFVGDVPWAHLDIAGPMNSDADSGWKSKGATGFGTRLLIDSGDRVAAARLITRSSAARSRAASQARAAARAPTHRPRSVAARGRVGRGVIVRRAHSSCVACRSSGRRSRWRRATRREHRAAPRTRRSTAGRGRT